MSIPFNEHQIQVLRNCLEWKYIEIDEPFSTARASQYRQKGLTPVDSLLSQGWLNILEKVVVGDNYMKTVYFARIHPKRRERVATILLTIRTGSQE